MKVSDKIVEHSHSGLVIKLILDRFIIGWQEHVDPIVYSHCEQQIFYIH